MNSEPIGVQQAKAEFSATVTVAQAERHLEILRANREYRTTEGMPREAYRDDMRRINEAFSSVLESACKGFDRKEAQR